MLKEKVIRDALSKCPWATRIVVQMDNAGGHDGGKGDISTTTLNRLNEWAADLPQEYRDLLHNPDNPPTIEFIAQPPRAPTSTCSTWGRGDRWTSPWAR